MKKLAIVLSLALMTVCFSAYASEVKENAPPGPIRELVINQVDVFEMTIDNAVVFTAPYISIDIDLCEPVSEVVDLQYDPERRHMEVVKNCKFLNAENRDNSNLTTSIDIHSPATKEMLSFYSCFVYSYFKEPVTKHRL